ncbi:MAG: MATE family efflux transporter [Hyphomicrobiales bacterium]
MAMTDRPVGDAPLGYTPTRLREARALVFIAAPLAAAYLSEHAMVITDRIIVGRLGSVELAAVGLAGDLMFEIALISMAVVAIVGVLVSRCIGEGENHRIRPQVRQGLWVAIMIGLPTTAFCYFLPEMLSFTSQDPEVLSIAKTYLTYAIWSILPYLWFTVFRQFLAALERLRSVLVIAASTVFLNALLTYSLVFGEFGMPEMGVAGAGLATAIISFFMAFALSVFVVTAPGLREYSLFTNIHKIDWSVISEIFKLGIPVGIIAGLESGLFAVIAILVGTFGAIALAANLAVTSSVAVVYIIVFSVGEAAALRVSYHMGRQAPMSARQSGFVAHIIGAFLMVIGATAFLLFPKQLASIYVDINDPENAPMVELATTLFAIAAAFQLSDGVQSISTRALRGLKDTYVPMWIAAIGYWGLGIGCGYLFAFELGYGSPGLWWGLTIGLTFAAIALTWRFHVLSSRLVANAR